MWTYYRDKYYARRDAVEAMNSALLSEPRVALALTQIAVAEAALDTLMVELAVEEDDDD